MLAKQGSIKCAFNKTLLSCFGRKSGIDCLYDKFSVELEISLWLRCRSTLWVSELIELGKRRTILWIKTDQMGFDFFDMMVLT